MVRLWRMAYGEWSESVVATNVAAGGEGGLGGELGWSYRKCRPNESHSVGCTEGKKVKKRRNCK